MQPNSAYYKDDIVMFEVYVCADVPMDLITPTHPSLFLNLDNVKYPDWTIVVMHRKLYFSSISG